MTVTIKNNICYSDGTGGNAIQLDPSTDDIAGSIDEDYNCLYGFANNKVRLTSGTLQQTLGVNNITTDPAFTDYANGDYTLENSSPCVGTGVDWFSPSTAPTLYNGVQLSSTNPDIGGNQTPAIISAVDTAIKTALSIDIGTKSPIDIKEANIQDATYTNYYVVGNKAPYVRSMWVQTTTKDSAATQATTILTAMTSDTLTINGNIDPNIGPP